MAPAVRARDAVPPMPTPKPPEEAFSIQPSVRGYLVLFCLAVGGILSAACGIMFRAADDLELAARERFRSELTTEGRRVENALSDTVSKLEALAGHLGIDWNTDTAPEAAQIRLAAAIHNIVDSSQDIASLDYVTSRDRIAVSSDAERVGREQALPQTIRARFVGGERCAIRSDTDILVVTVPVETAQGLLGVLSAEISGTALLAGDAKTWCAIRDASGRIVCQRGTPPEAIAQDDSWRSVDREVAGVIVASVVLETASVRPTELLRVTGARRAQILLGLTRAMKSQMTWVGAGAVLTIILGVFSIIRYAGAFSVRLADSERELQEQSEEHYRTIDALTSETERARTSNMATIELINTVNRELRAPVNRILGQSEMLFETELDGKQSKFARSMQRAARGLATLPDKLIEFTKADAGSLYFDHVECNLKELIEDAIDLVSQPANDKNLEICTTLRSCVPTHVRCDPGRIRRVLVSALANAIDSSSDGEIGVHAYVEGEEGARTFVRFEVSDEGSGSSDDRTAKLGDIVVLVEQMGGELQVDEALGDGSVAWFVLPLEIMPGRTRESIDQPGCFAGLRVLIVEDGAGARSTLEHWLGGWGSIVRAVESADAALTLLGDASIGAHSYDVTLIDFELQGDGGPKVLRRIRKSRRLSAMTVVTMTSLARLAALEQSGFGAGSMLAKPLRRSQVLAMLTAVAHSRDAKPAYPLSPLPKSEKAPDRGAEHPMTRHYSPVLIAEDNEANQRLADRIVRKLGLETVIVPDGAQAVEATGTGTFSLILMDVMMPVMDGIEATKRIRESELGSDRHIPILTLTANAAQDDQERCIQAGADVHIPKPVNRKQLEMEILRWAEWSYGRAAGAEPEASRPDVKDS